MPATDAEIRDLYTRYAHVLHYRARAILGTDEDAADCVQETFARVIRHWDAYRQQASPLTWMYQIGTNWCLNKLRDRRGHHKKHEDHREELFGDGSTPAFEGDLDAETLRELLTESDDETRRIVVHLYFDDMTREETAVQVGISVPTLRKRLDAFFRRARRTLGVTAVPAALALLLVLIGGWP